MAKAGEIEVFRMDPQVGKCYEHIEATRSVYVGQGNYRYFSENQPTYVGKFLRKEQFGQGNLAEYYSFFDNNGKENKIEYSYEGYTCFKEVACRPGGGMRKRSRRTRRKLKTRKHRK